MATTTFFTTSFPFYFTYGQKKTGPKGMLVDDHSKSYVDEGCTMC